jgi:hypothetical protein
MNSTMTKENSFIGYEYKEVTVSRKMESVFADGYVNFGWEQVDDTSSAIMPENLVTSVQKYGSVIMKFKRDRKIRNKMELTRLQRQFESCISEIEKLERSIEMIASAVAFGIGILGTVFMAGSVFSYLGGRLFLSILLAVHAFVGWIIPYFSFVTLTRKKATQIAPLIDQKYDEIYAVCEKANALLSD